ncbi:YchJ family protein [Sinomonas sp.]|uniref:YchJ family protein n=1 Tax=Sinomonas sp. TaxID=1914986 RepID=UPI003F81651E
MTLDPGTRCPCGSGDTYGDCCRRFHAGVPAPTAEALMRSRFSAFATGNADYLLTTWHPSTRPATLDLDEGTQWRRLVVVRTEAGGPFDDRGVVEFAAHYTNDDGATGVLRETSRFVREGGRWHYVDGR